MTRISEFEGVRGLLAYWVVLGHVSNSLALDVPSPLPKDLSGHSAVVVFIVLSGFVITHLLLEKQERYGAFLVRRFFRLFPAYVVCLFASVALLDVAAAALELAPRTPATAGRLQLLQLGRSELGLHVLAHLSMLHGLLDPVLPKSSYTLLGQAWSVSVEWQFYLVAPLVVATFFAGRVRAALALFVLGAAWVVLVDRAGQGALPTHAAPFALGVAYCHVWRALDQGRIRWSAARARAFSLGCCALGCLVMEERPAVVVWCAVAHVVLFRAATPAEHAASPEGAVSRLLASPSLERLGAISYSVYLGHMIVLYPILFGLGRANASATVQATVLVAGVVAGSWLLAEALYAFVERPGIRLGSRLAARLDASRTNALPSAPRPDGAL